MPVGDTAHRPIGWKPSDVLRVYDRRLFSDDQQDSKGLTDVVAAGKTRWFGLAVLLAVQFMVVLDIAIVNVALPSIQVDLGFSQENLQWVISAYALVFGGFMLLGGRAADLVGRRRVFLLGLVVFTTGSLLCGLAWSEASLIGARGIQGLGAAIITPAALSILTTTFQEGRERNIALGLWGAVGGFGAAAGVLMGGVLTDVFSWPWIFFVNVPVGVLAFVLTPFLLGESRDARAKSFDALGAVLVTGGLSLLVLAITQGNGWGWSSLTTIGTFAASAALLAGFVAWELRVEDPLMRFGIFRTRTVLGANITGFILGTALFAMFLMLTLYMQQVLHYSPLKTGVAYLAVAGTSIIWANVAAALVGRVGVKPLIASGMALLAVGMVLFTQLEVGGSYWLDLFPSFLIIAMGLAFCFVPISIAALAGVKPAEAGLASGLINTSQQIGGAVGIAVLSTVATTLTENEVADGTPVASAAVNGFQAAFWVGAGIALAGVVAALVFIRKDELEAAPASETVPVLDAA
jgi:EmrB/QacA subfamily drug resistance transporter